MHHPNKAHRVPAAFISFNALRGRKSGFRPPPKGWVMDSGAFTTVNKHGGYPESAKAYGVEAARLSSMTPGLLAIVAQDYMCEPFVLAKTGLTIADHQRLTVERYDELAEVWDLFDGRCPVMPVLQGFAPEDYAVHIALYGARLALGAWVGVGSVCKRQGDPRAILAVLRAIKAVRPDLRLHGFGVKLTALRHPEVRDLLHTADSMAWSFSARKQGRDANSADEALAFYQKVAALSS